MNFLTKINEDKIQKMKALQTQKGEGPLKKGSFMHWKRETNSP
jgi:hypothetical protein